MLKQVAAAALASAAVLSVLSVSSATGAITPAAPADLFRPGCPYLTAQDVQGVFHKTITLEYQYGKADHPHSGICFLSPPHFAEQLEIVLTCDVSASDEKFYKDLFLKSATGRIVRIRGLGDYAAAEVRPPVPQWPGGGLTDLFVISGKTMVETSTSLPDNLTGGGFTIPRQPRFQVALARIALRKGCR